MTPRPLLGRLTCPKREDAAPNTNDGALSDGSPSGPGASCSIAEAAAQAAWAHVLFRTLSPCLARVYGPHAALPAKLVGPSGEGAGRGSSGPWALGWSMRDARMSDRGAGG
jgi:hypothetical protein